MFLTQAPQTDVAAEVFKRLDTVGSKIEAMAKQMGVTAQQAWTVLVAHARMEAVSDMVVGVAWLFAVIVLLVTGACCFKRFCRASDIHNTVYKKWSANPDRWRITEPRNNGDGYAIAAIVCAVFSVIFGLAAASYLKDGFINYNVPEYVALKQVAEFLK